ncbi:bifunctional adenosylcobinamide kinase/adenosylcobinamide-phosphate guanylyltransferase [Candidatus Poribacteria bacterium]|nr:bifunctional adenosylcobinamide kinase/adenosylcobinamide-phosphate guanylyltransferase [Candidatus Poribacteria bacterium]
MSCITFITGGARSGKSNLALKLAGERGNKIAFIATATAKDEEMKKRIEIHKDNRPLDWSTIEEPLDIASAIRSVLDHDLIIIDCITLLVTNLMFSDESADENTVVKGIKEMISAIREFNGAVIIVSNEVGMGIVPDNKLSRDFRDYAGRANQMIVEAADEFYVCFSGMPLRLK